MADPNDPIQMEVRTGGSAVDGLPFDDESVVGSERVVRWGLAAGLVAVVLVAVGVWIGRVTAPTEVAEAPPDTTMAAAPEPSVRVLDTVPPADTVPPVTTSAPAGEEAPAETPDEGQAPDDPDPAGTSADTVELDPRVAGADLRIVGLGNGKLLELDFATSTLTETEVESLQVRSDIPQSVRQVVAGVDWTLVGDPWGGTTSLIRQGEEPIEIGFHDIVAYEPGSESFWALDRSGSQIIEMDLTGEPTGNSTELSEYEVVRGDPAGGVVIERGGRMYSLIGSGATALPVGDLLAISAELVVVYVCDDDLVCTVRVVNRVSGEVREVVPEESFQPLNRALFGIRTPSDAQSISPTGDHAVMMTFENFGFQAVVLDLRTGAMIPMPSAADPWSVSTAWTPDGDVLVLCTGTRLWGLDVATGESFVAAMGAGGTIWYRIAARPT